MFDKTMTDTVITVIKYSDQDHIEHLFLHKINAIS